MTGYGISETVENLVDRVLRDWLYQPDDQPSRGTITHDLSSTSTTITYSPTVMLPEESFLAGPGTLIEIDREQIIVGNVDPHTRTFSNVLRGANGTTPTSHPSSSIFYIRPAFTRQSVFQSLCGAIGRLYPRLYVRKTVPIELGTAPTPVPSDARLAERVYLDSPAGPVSVQFRMFDFPGSDTGRLLKVRGESHGAGWLVYRAPIRVPTSEQDLLSNLGILPEFEDVIVVATAGHLIGPRDFGNTTVEALSQQIESDGFPVGAGMQLRQAMRVYYEDLIREVMANLNAQYGTIQSFNGWSGVEAGGTLQ